MDEKNAKDLEKDNIEEVSKEENVSNPEAEEYYAQLQRVMADFDNYRKRTTKEKEALYSIISAEIITEILPIMDSLDKSVKTEGEDETSKAWRTGVELICRQFLDVLTKLGAEEIATVGEKFDPNFHNAVMHIEDPEVGEKIVVEELRKGYKLKDRIIRHSMVKVAN